MPASFQTSFIPKKSLIAETTKAKKSGINLVAIIAAIIFIIALLLSGAAFLYNAYLSQSIATNEAKLAKAKEGYEPATIEELRHLNGRIEASKELIKNHIALSPLFESLERDTLASVRFVRFDYGYSSDGKIKLTMDGAARSFGAIALQSDQFGKSRYLKSPIFSNLNLDRDGNVTFSFSALVDPALISYERLKLEASAGTDTSVPATDATLDGAAADDSASASTTLP
jgi:hypothetical protein